MTDTPATQPRPSPPPLVSATDPQTSVSTPVEAKARLRVEPNDIFLRDAINRAWLMRGVNLSGCCKFPKYPVPVPSHVGGDAFLKRRNQRDDSTTIEASTGNRNKDDIGQHEQRNESDNPTTTTEAAAVRAEPTADDLISFVGRPFELEEADEHLARLRHWGFRMIRWVVTWEAVEHQGPGRYDEDFLDYTVKALLKAKEYGFKVMIDFHQDVWSRFSGGSGAPLWTFYAAGLDPHNFAATGAAVVHNTLQDNEPLLRMVWLTNYYKLACASMFTLFYAGKILAPKCMFDQGVNIQDYLQSHFLGAIQALVDRIHECKDAEGAPLLEDHVVLGYDSWNEPSNGWIGLGRLDMLPDQHDMRQGDMPTPLQSLMLGEGLVVEDVATYKLELVGPVKSGSRTINPSAHLSSHGRPTKAWLSPELRDELDRQYGIRRDPGFPKAGECLWAQHGVWSIKERKILQQDYFARGPESSLPTAQQRDLIQWVPDHWLPFARRVTEIVRKVHPTAILFLEPPVYVPPPDLTHLTSKSDKASDDELITNMVYAPHHYDDLVLLTKRYLGWINIDLLGLSRGRHKNLFRSIVLGKKATETLFGKQIGEIQKECYERLGETGLHFDVGLDKARQAGSIKRNDSTSTNISKVTQTTPPAATSKQFQQAFDNILNGLDKTMAHYTLWNYTIGNDASFGDGWNGENLSLYCSNSAYVERKDGHKLDRGGRAIEQFCRPYPIATVGQPTEISFDRHKKVFKLRTKFGIEEYQAAVKDTDAAMTEVYVPAYHFPGGPKNFAVTLSDGLWEWKTEQQILLWVYSKNSDIPDHWIEIRKRRR
ncbi:hypothetical protein BGZ54_007327 [Gamsiella multidivaricata]|nr:hypothetical protein BGZ54_007327 [Gamsiella multidivaricata]